jgi:hypothetical protein
LIGTAAFPFTKSCPTCPAGAKLDSFGIHAILEDLLYFFGYTQFGALFVINPDQDVGPMSTLPPQDDCYPTFFSRAWEFELLLDFLTKPHPTHTKWTDRSIHLTLVVVDRSDFSPRLRVIVASLVFLAAFLAFFKL